MLELIESFPLQVSAARDIGARFKLPTGFKSPYRNVVCTGLGGSAIGADIARSYVAGEAKIPISVNRNYTLPRYVNKDSLVIVSSYSGNTEETLSAYRDARSKGAKIVGITSGGELEKEARTDGFPVIMIPAGLPPRCALGYAFFPLLILLSKTRLIKDKAREIDDTIDILNAMRKRRIGFDVPEKANSAKAIAREIILKLPVIYAAQDHFDSVATRWRGQLAENSKTLASSHVLPEMTHNEIEGWENPKDLMPSLVVMMLRDKDDHPRISKRMRIVSEIIASGKVKVIDVRSVGKGLLSRIFSLIYMGDFVSFYLAILNKRDPTPVDRIGSLKERLAKG